MKEGILLNTGWFTTPWKMGKLKEDREGGQFILFIIPNNAEGYANHLNTIEFNISDSKDSFFEIPAGKYLVNVKFESKSEKYKIENQSIEIEIKPNTTTVIKYELGKNYKSSLRFIKYKNQ
jgi:hypothetical protein